MKYRKKIINLWKQVNILRVHTDVDGNGHH